MQLLKGTPRGPADAVWNPAAASPRSFALRCGSRAATPRTLLLVAACFSQAGPDPAMADVCPAPRRSAVQDDGFWVWTQPTLFSFFRITRHCCSLWYKLRVNIWSSIWRGMSKYPCCMLALYWRFSEKGYNFKIGSLKVTWSQVSTGPSRNRPLTREFCSSLECLYLHTAYVCAIESQWSSALVWDWKWTCCLSVFSCWSLFLFDLGLSSFPVVSPFIYSNVQNPTVFGTFWGGLLPPNAACDRVVASVQWLLASARGRWVELLGLTPAGLVKRSSLGLLARGWWWDVGAVHEAHHQSGAWTLVCGL